MGNSMKSRMKRSFIGMGVLTMLVTAVVCMVILSAAYTRRVVDDMEMTADMLCRSYESESQGDLSLYENPNLRITLISPEGAVSVSYTHLDVYKRQIHSCILHTGFHVDLVPANIDLSGAEVELIGVEKREYLLRNQLNQVKDSYDFVWIDCPPSLNMLTVNAFCSADSVLVPIQCEFYALEGLSQLLNTINLVKRRLNPTIEIEGIVFTMYDNRTNLCNDCLLYTSRCV